MRMNKMVKDNIEIKKLNKTIWKWKHKQRSNKKIQCWQIWTNMKSWNVCIY